MAIRWQKSSFSEHPDGECIEIALHHGHLMLRESDDPDLVLDAGTESLRAFLAGAKTGRLSELQ